ncbi:MAG: hypothetical protein V8S34_07920 [Lawsonibacter sp.]
MGEALADRGFALRAGLHCAPLAHRTAGTLDTGTVRASVSAFKPGVGGGALSSDSAGHDPVTERGVRRDE